LVGALLCEGRVRTWLDWRKDALELPKQIEEPPTAIDYGELVGLIDDHADAIERYQEQGRDFKKYEETLNRLAELPPSGTRSFLGARAAVLQKFGARPSGKDRSVVATTGDCRCLGCRQTQ
jgi:hypothetical protein